MILDSADGQSIRALSIRQPYAELILRGIKTIEYRSRPTRAWKRVMHLAK
ncbi:MAG: ASCH domain-containing protein [Planctomycetes bacterium]|nr:ASCH domain-containing protein [Planctomycetota bacterium]